MKNRLKGPLVGSLMTLTTLGLGTLACSRTPDNVQRTETTSTSAEGTVKTVSESKQVGNTLEAKTETKVDSKEGMVKTTTETFVGTVTVYTPGKKIEILTGEKSKHEFALDEKGLVASVDQGVAVGSRVTIVDQKGDSGVRRISVTVGG